jgi:hypothetical protein
LSGAEPARRRSREVCHEPPIQAGRARYQGGPRTADAGECHMSNLRPVEFQRSRADRLTSGLPVLRLSHRVLPAQWTDFYSLLMLAWIKDRRARPVSRVRLPVSVPKSTTTAAVADISRSLIARRHPFRGDQPAPDFWAQTRWYADGPTSVARPRQSAR